MGVHSGTEPFYYFRISPQWVRVDSFVYLHVFPFFVWCCDVRSDFYINSSSDSHLFCMGTSYIYGICYYLCILLSYMISISDNVCLVQQ